METRTNVSPLTLLPNTPHCCRVISQGAWQPENKQEQHLSASWPFSRAVSVRLPVPLLECAIWWVTLPSWGVDMYVNKAEWGVRQIIQWLKEKSSCDLELWIHAPTDFMYYNGHEFKGVPGRFKPLGAGLCEDLMHRGMEEGAQGSTENWSWSSSWSSQQSDCCGYFHGFSEIQLTSQQIHLFKVYNSMIFNIFRAVWLSHSLILGHFHHLKKKPNE